MRYGQKHLISCRCTLRQHRELLEPPNFYFIVFSIIENNNVIAKYIECPNCGAIHFVNELCKSEIVSSDNNKNYDIVTRDKIKINVPERLHQILEDYNCELHTYEEAKYILDNKLWSSKIILTNEQSSYDNEVYNEGRCVIIKSAVEYEIDYWKAQY